MSFQISGLSSGFDWQSMIDQLMAIEQRPIKLLQQRQNKLKLQQQAWMDVNTRLATLRNKLDALKLESTFLGHRTSVSSESALKATAKTNAVNGTYHVTIHQLATASSRKSTADIGSPLDTTVLLNKAGFATNITSGTITINGKQYDIDTSSDSLDSLATKLAADGITLSYNAASDELTLSSAVPLELGSASDTSNFLQVTRLSATLTDGNTTVTVAGLGTVKPNVKLNEARFQTALGASNGSFTINGVEIEWDAKTDTLNDVLKRINRSDAGVTARYDSYTDQVILESKKTGNLDITLGTDTGGLLASLQLTGSILTKGQNASITVDELNGGMPIQSTSNQIEIVEGLTLQLLEADPTKEITVTVSSDTETAISAIRAFVEQYNSVQEFIASKLDVGDPKNPDDGGILAGNPTLMRIQSSLRRLVTSNFADVAGSYRSLHEIGISTTSDKTARLQIDESKLIQALELHPDDVRSLFFGEVNIALGTAGSSISASSEFSSDYPVASVIDGITSSDGWGAGQGWSDATAGVFPDVLTIDFGKMRYIEKVVIHTLDSAGMPAANFGIRDFTLTSFYRSTSRELASIAGNTEGVITSLFASTKAERLQISIDDSNDGQHARIIEVEVYEFNGLAAMLDREIDSLIHRSDGIITSQTAGLQESIDDLSERMESMERRIEAMRETMVRKFVAMETALAQMQTQSAWLTSQLAGLNANWNVSRES